MTFINGSGDRGISCITNRVFFCGCGRPVPYLSLQSIVTEMDYPYKGLRFLAIIDDMIQARISEVNADGIVIEPPPDIRAGNSKIFTPATMPEIRKYGNVTLKWCVSHGMEFYNWITAMSVGGSEPKEVTIRLTDSMDDIKVHYNSSPPAAIAALQYAQGTDIRVDPGREHLPHRPGHVVQQHRGQLRSRGKE